MHPSHHPTSKLGKNRTGIDVSPALSQEMVRGIDDNHVVQHQGLRGLSAVRLDALQSAEPIGSIPVPASLTGVLGTLQDRLKGRSTEVLINKLGERLVFERTGVRLYEALITKCEAWANNPIGATFTIDELRRIRNEEAEHLALLTEVILSMGGDPTAETPDADASGVTASGVLQVIVDPRTSLAQSLQALLAAELVDGCGWETLIMLCRDFGMEEVAERFEQVLQQENDHAEKVKHWYTAMVMNQAGVPLPASH